MTAVLRAFDPARQSCPSVNEMWVAYPVSYYDRSVNNISCTSTIFCFSHFYVPASGQAILRSRSVPNLITRPSVDLLLASVCCCCCCSRIIYTTAGVSQLGGGVPEQGERLIEGSRLIHSSFWVPSPRGTRRFRPPYIAMPPYSDRIIGGIAYITYFRIISSTTSTRFIYYTYPPADGREKRSISSPHVNVLSYMSCVNLAQMLSQPSASWRILQFPWQLKREPLQVRVYIN